MVQVEKYLATLDSHFLSWLHDVKLVLEHNKGATCGPYQMSDPERRSIFACAHVVRRDRLGRDERSKFSEGLRFVVRASQPAVTPMRGRGRTGKLQGVPIAHGLGRVD